MKHISLMAIVMAFSINASAKSILCASTDESILISVSAQEQAISGMHHAESMKIQRSSLGGKLIETGDVAGGIDVQDSSAYFIARVSGINTQDDVSAVHLNIDDYKEGKDIVLKALLKIDTKLDEKFMKEETHDMNCVTHLEVGI